LGIQTSFAAIIWDQSHSNYGGLRHGIKDAIATLKEFHARRIATEFSESKYIGISIYILFQALMIAFPVLYFFSVDSNANFLTKLH